MKLQEYNSLEEKSKFFKENNTIDTLPKLKECLDNLHNNNQLLFRGVNNARYKLFCSMQRKWLSDDIQLNFKLSYSDYINTLLQNHKQIIERFGIENFPIWQNDWNSLAFLQHYGAPTPFIDFTTDVDVALFFGIHNLSLNSEDNVDGYFSIYWLCPEDNDIFKMSTLLARVKDDVEPKLKNKQLPSSNKVGNYISYIAIINHLANNILWIDSKTIPPIMDEENYLDFNLLTKNPNMIAQKGELFAIKIGDKPLEEILANKLCCANIRKSLVPYIQRYLIDKDITSNSIFPSFEQIAKQCIETTDISLSINSLK